MDREQFDALAKLVWTKRSRRTAVAAVLGSVLVGMGPSLAVAKPQGKNKRKRRRKNKSQRPCYPGTSCIPGPGKDNAGCDFASSARFFEGNFQGSNLSGANLTGAQLANADLQGADLGGACLVGANLHEADLGGVNLDGAIFCQTLMPDGSIDDSGCDRGTRCCPTPCQGEACGEQDCINTINHVCSILGTPCCGHTLPEGGHSGSCSGPAPIPVVGFCEWACNTDRDCTELFGTGARCVGDVLFCLRESLCCQWHV